MYAKAISGNTGEPIANARIRVLRRSGGGLYQSFPAKLGPRLQNVWTDKAGEASFEVSPDENYTINAYAEGFLDYEQNYLAWNRADTPTPLEIELVENSAIPTP